MVGIKFGEFKGQVVYKESVKNGELLKVATIVKNKPVVVEVSVDPSHLLDDKRVVLEPSLVLDLPKEKFPSVAKVKTDPFEASYMIKERVARFEFKVNCLTRDQQNVLFRMKMRLVRKKEGSSEEEEEEEEILREELSCGIKVVSKPAKKSEGKKEEKKNSSGTKRKRSEMEEEREERANSSKSNEKERERNEEMERVYSEIANNTNLLLSIHSSLAELKSQISSKMFSEKSNNNNNNIVLPICFPIQSVNSSHANVLSGNFEERNFFAKMENEEIDSLLDGLELEDKKEGRENFSEKKELKTETLEEEEFRPLKKRNVENDLEENFRKFCESVSFSFREGTRSEEAAERMEREMSFFSKQKRREVMDLMRKLVEKENTKDETTETTTTTMTTSTSLLNCEEAFSPSFSSAFQKSNEWSGTDFVDNFFNDEN